MKRIAINEANKSTFERARMGAVITKGKRVIAVGHNQIRHCKGHFKRKWINSIHAEQDAIYSVIKSGRSELLTNSTLICTRINNRGELRNSLPCSICRELIIAVGIKKVWYTNEHSDWVLWRVNDGWKPPWDA